jgi:hypothetical protein
LVASVSLRKLQLRSRRARTWFFCSSSPSFSANYDLKTPIYPVRQAVGGEDELLELGVVLQVLTHFGSSGVVDAIMLEAQEDDRLVVLQRLR